MRRDEDSFHESADRLIYYPVFKQRCFQSLVYVAKYLISCMEVGDFVGSHDRFGCRRCVPFCSGECRLQ